jgi:predicted transcriptional regulator
MGDRYNDAAGAALAVQLAREARALLDELRAVLRRPSAVGAVQALRALFDLPEEQVEQLCRDMTAQRVGAFSYIEELLARRCHELAGQAGVEPPAVDGRA